MEKLNHWSPAGDHWSCRKSERPFICQVRPLILDSGGDAFRCKQKSLFHLEEAFLRPK